MDRKTTKILFSLLSLLIVAVFQYQSGSLSKFNQHLSESLALEHCSVNQTLESRNIFSIQDVVDGDTVDILKDCHPLRLRLIGINTPETVDPRKSVQCFGPEASAEAKKILSGRTIRLENDPGQGEFDKYGRTLVYIFLSHDSMPTASSIYDLSYNDFMIRQGFAYEYTYNKAYKYQKEFKEAQIEAKENQRGLWSSSTCNGKL